MTYRYMAISLTRYGLLGSARVKDGLKESAGAILDNVRDIEILKGDKAVNALPVRPKWDNADDTAHTYVSIHCIIYALLQYFRPIGAPLEKPRPHKTHQCPPFSAERCCKAW
jgi:hypothetical protein